MRRFATALPLLLSLSLGACAGPQASSPAAAPSASTDSSPEKVIERAAGKMASEENLGLFFGLLRQSLSAAAEGKPAPEMSPADKARIEATSKELQRAALEASMRMIDQVEKEMRETIRNEGLGK